MTAASAISPTRFASRTTLPARGRDKNGAIQPPSRTFVQGEMLAGLRFVSATRSLPLTGRVARREPSWVG
jgi:hypothetical protein